MITLKNIQHGGRGQKTARQSAAADFYWDLKLNGGVNGPANRQGMLPVSPQFAAAADVKIHSVEVEAGGLRQSA